MHKPVSMAAQYIHLLLVNCCMQPSLGAEASPTRLQHWQFSWKSLAKDILTSANTLAVDSSSNILCRFEDIGCLYAQTCVNGSLVNTPAPCELPSLVVVTAYSVCVCVCVCVCVVGLYV